jgi:hypothetical protein
MSDVSLLVDVHEAADLLRISVAAVRAMVQKDALIPVRLPSTRPGNNDSRRLLFARSDLVALIEARKRTSMSTPNEQLAKAALKGWAQSPVRKRA